MNNLTDLTKIILPAILTVLGNIIVYWFIKKRVDNSLEKHKIAFSGLYKERIDIYRTILQKIYDIKYKILRYQYITKYENEIFEDINAFINYYLVNQVFLSDELLTELRKWTKEHQDVFDSFYLYHNTSNISGSNEEIKSALLKKFFQAGNKLKTDGPFKQIEETITQEMRNDLRVDQVKG